MQKLNILGGCGLAALAFILPLATASAEPAASAIATKGSGDDAYIVDGNGAPLYLFTIDDQGAGYATPSSKCAGKCAGVWQPLSAETGVPKAKDDAKADLIGSMNRADGTKQVTYNGWPVYTFIRDLGKDTPQGQDKHGFGGEWYLLTPDGKKLDED
jgi:predicted lipoprotein with Yx(FWY)xxD motif